LDPNKGEMLKTVFFSEKLLALKGRGAAGSPKKFCEIRNRNKDKQPKQQNTKYNVDK